MDEMIDSDEITQQYYDKMLSKMLCKITYHPIDAKDFDWEFYCIHTDVDIFKSRPVCDGTSEITVYEKRCEQWLTIKPDKIVNIEFPSYRFICDDYECELSSGIEAYDPIGDKTMVTETITGDNPTMTPLEWLENDCPEQIVDPDIHKKYIDQIIKELRSISDEKHGDTSKTDVWRVCFEPRAAVDKWEDIMKALYDTVERDLVFDQVDMVKAQTGWKRVIDEKHQYAEKFLQDEKTDILSEAKAAPQDMPESKEEIEEIDVIIDLLGEQVEEHKDYVDERENIFDLVTTWPPMLLPAPFKRRGPDDSEIDMDEEYQT